MNVVIVGGGTAGWMTTAALCKTFSDWDITIIEGGESIGVGESTTPHINQYLKYMEIDDETFLREARATYKSSTVLNYCKLDSNFIKYFLDTTPTKEGKYTPGTHIPIFKYKGIPKNIDYAFLGAWNFKDEIFKKEKSFIKRGGKFITHVPNPKIL